MRQRYLEVAKHPRISECVGLHSGKIQELSNTLVVRERDGGVHVIIDQLIGDLVEAVASEEVHLESETEESRQTELTGIHH